MKTTRKISVLLIVLIGSAIMIRCSSDSTVKEEKASPREESVVSSNEYNAAITAKNDAEEALYKTMSEINDNLKGIRISQGLLINNYNSSSGEKLSSKEEILRTIAEINSLLSQNKSKIGKLNTQLATLKSEKMRWKKEAADIQKFIDEKEVEMSDLQEQIVYQTNTINGLNKKVDELQSENETVNKNAQRMDGELHKAYYAMGNYKELKQHNVLEEKGGILGLGKTEELNPEFEKAYFTEIDTRQVVSIPVNCRSAKLVTHHPVGSYEWDKFSNNLEYLTIKDPDKFWATSKYLVVEMK
ncbi:MAG TPA: hypothetical protein VNY73_02760 [Bacteroidia bacterium]|jgi:chromosome segregation ATPase|nr:hypothetical protein [Bacteroidia bacterium]